MSDIDAVLNRARPEILALSPYVSARMSASEGLILLNANESPTPLIPDATGAGVNRYPDPQPVELRRRWSSHMGTERERVLITRGSDEAIDLLIRAFCRAQQDAIVQCSPCFGMYAVAARIQGARVIDVALTTDHDAPSESLDLDGLREALTDDGVKLVFLTHPNNPTGRPLSESDVADAIELTQGRALLVIDEAYVEYCADPSFIQRCASMAHVVVLRTLSKAFGLAGARIGAMVAHPEVIALCRRIIPPYPLPSPSVIAGESALSEEGLAKMKSSVGITLTERARVSLALQSSGRASHVWPSSANFVLAKFNDSQALYRHWIDGGVIVRDFSDKPGLAGCLRVTIGLPEENDRLLTLLETFEA